MSELPIGSVLTGSRAFGVASASSDWDYVATTPPCGTGWKAVPYGISDGYLIYRHANRNLIVCLSRCSHERWMQAHRHCLIERPRSKDRRRVIFDHYMYRMPLDRVTPLPRQNRAWFLRGINADV